MMLTSKFNLANTGIAGTSSISISPVPIDGYAVSSSITTNPIDLRNIRYLSVMISFATGSTCVGSVSLQVSDDKEDPMNNIAIQAANWTIPTVGGNTATSSVSSGAGNYTFEYPLVCHRWVRVAYTNTSGSGTVSMSFTIKD